MADDRLTSYADIPALEAEQTKIIKLVDDTITHIQSKQKELGNVQISLLDANSAKASNDGIREAKKLIDSLSGSVYTYKQLLAQLTEVEEKKTKATAEQRIELAKIRLETEKAKAATIESKKSYLEEAAAIRSSAAEKKKYAIDTTIARDSNIALSKTLQDLRKGYDLLTKAERENADIGGVLASRIQEVDAQLKATDASTGRYQRNVGNYSSATANLNRNIGVLATELPNAGISIRTFAQSLSNNITPFIQSIKEVQAQNVQLKKDGLATTSVIKTLGQSLLSTGVITGIAVAVGLKLVDMWEQSQKAAKEAAKATDELKEARVKALESAEQTAAKEQSSLDILYRTATDLTQTYATRSAAVKKLQEEYPAYFKNLNTEAFLAGEATAAYKELTNAIIVKSEITAAESELEILAKQIRSTEKRIELEKQFANVQEVRNLKDAKASAESDPLMSGKFAKQRQILDRSQREVNKLYEDRNKIVDDILDKERQIPKLLVENETLKEAGKGKAAKEAKEKKDPNADNLEDFQKAMFDRAEKNSKELRDKILNNLNDVELKQLQVQEKSLEDLLVSFEKGEIGIEEYNKKKEQITKTTEDNILKLQLDSLREYLIAGNLSMEDIAKIEEKITNLTIKEIEARNKAREGAAIKTYLTEKELREKAQKEIEKAVSFEENARMNLNQKIISGAYEVADLVVEAFKASYERKQEELVKENENIDANTQIQIKAIEESTLAEEEKQRRISEAEAVAAAEKEKNELRIAELKTRSARLDKMIEIAKIGGQTISDIAALKGQLSKAIGSASTLSSAALANPLLVPAASAMAASVGVIGATIGLTAGIGAAQIAAVAARPIPKYAEGTLGHKGGLAILGDGKEHELVIEPNKKPYWSANTDTLYNLPKHTQVIPESKLGSAVTQPSNKDVVMAVMEMSGLIDGGLNKLNRTIRNKETVRLEAKNRRWQDYYYENAKA
jgi:hypothetical protein